MFGSDLISGMYRTVVHVAGPVPRVESGLSNVSAGEAGSPLVQESRVLPALGLPWPGRSVLRAVEVEIGSDFRMPGSHC